MEDFLNTEQTTINLGLPKTSYRIVGHPEMTIERVFDGERMVLRAEGIISWIEIEKNKL